MTSIEWTDVTWNPVTGCSKVSPGCAHCYAERVTHRFNRDALPWTPANAAVNVVLHPERLDAPLHWRKPRRVFVNSMSDLFHENVPDEFIARVFAVMALSPWHTYQVLTKRPELMHAYMTDFALRVNAHGWPEGVPMAPRFRANGLPNAVDWPLPNVWLGVSVENQHWADERIPLLLQTPAAVRFVSCEPLLGPVDLSRWMGCNDPGCCTPWLDWVIVGGESGPKARPMDLAWARSLRDQCRAASVPFFMKQLGGARPGASLEALPDDLRVREWPR